MLPRDRWPSLLPFVLLAMGGCGLAGYDRLGAELGDSGPLANFCGPTDGLLAWFPMDDPSPFATVADSSGNQVSARCEVAGHCPVPVTGVVGNALQFSADDGDYIRIAVGGDQTQSFSSVDGFTIAFFMKADSQPSLESKMVSKHVDLTSDTDSYEFDLTAAGKLRLETDYEGNGGTAVEEPLEAFGEFVHVAATWAGPGTKMKIYQRGSLSKTDDTGANVVFDSNDVFIGADQDVDSGVPDINDYFDGVIDDLKFYRRALDDSEIATLAGCSD